MSQNPEYWRSYLKDSIAWLEAAKNNMKTIPMVSYYVSGFAVEIALKAVLCKNGKLTKDLMQGNSGHNIDLLKTRIVENNCLPHSFFSNEVKKAIRNVAHANVHMSGEIFINTVKQRSTTRYPKEGIASYDYITPKMAEDEYNYADHILSKIQESLGTKIVFSNMYP